MKIINPATEETLRELPEELLRLLAVVTLGIATGVLVALIAYETVRFAELRERLRHQAAEPA